MAVDPYTTGAAVVGMGANYLQGRSAAKAQKEVARRQAQTISMQNENFRAAQPAFRGVMREYMNRAGLRDENGVQQVGDGHYNLGGMPGQPQNYGLGGQYGSPELQMRLRAAEEDINKRRTMQANQLRHQLGGAGVAQASVGAALARNQSEADQQYAGFRRQLAIDADAEQERRLAALQQMISLGFGQGSQAMAGMGQQSQMYGQQQAAANQGMSNIMGQWAMGRQLQGLGGAGGTMDRYGPSLGGMERYQPTQQDIDELMFYLGGSR